MKTGMSPKAYENFLVQTGHGKGTKLRRLRVKQGLSQSDLSEVTGISMKNIQRFEQSPEPINRAKLSTIVSLCLALNCRVEDILEDEGLLDIYNGVK